MNKKSRLRKKLSSHFPNETDRIFYRAPGFLFKNIDQKIVDKDEIIDVTYGPSISREWLFDKPIDNPEWSLQNNFTKGL